MTRSAPLMGAKAVHEAAALLAALQAVNTELSALATTGTPGRRFTFEFGASFNDCVNLQTVSLPRDMIESTLKGLARSISDRLAAIGVDPWA